MLCETLLDSAKLRLSVRRIGILIFLDLDDNSMCSPDDQSVWRVPVFLRQHPGIPA